MITEWIFHSVLTLRHLPLSWIYYKVFNLFTSENIIMTLLCCTIGFSYNLKSIILLSQLMLGNKDGGRNQQWLGRSQEKGSTAGKWTWPETSFLQSTASQQNPRWKKGQFWHTLLLNGSSQDKMYETMATEIEQLLARLAGVNDKMAEYT